MLRLVELPPAAMTALLDGDLATASAAAGVPLTDYFITDEAKSLWRFRLAQLAREGTTMLMATHDLRLASTIAGSVVFLDKGEIVEAGPAASVFGSPQRDRTRRFIASLGAPATV